jgi:hypothetical protein
MPRKVKHLRRQSCGFRSGNREQYRDLGSNRIPVRLKE